MAVASAPSRAKEHTLTSALQAGSATNATKSAPRSTVSDTLNIVLESLDSSKAEDVTPIDISGKSPLSDHLVVASGRSHRHVGAIAEHLITDLKRQAGVAPRVEGLPHCDWVLVDAGDVVVHIFRPEVRSFYNLEKMWQLDTLVTDKAASV